MTTRDSFVTVANGDQLDDGYFNEIPVKLSLTKSMLQLVLDLDTNNIFTFTRANYDNLSWDTFKNTTYYDAGSSSQVVLNNTAKLVALDVDATNQTYAADMTGASRDGTYTTDVSAGGTITFDATDNEEDYVLNGNNTGTIFIQSTATYRDGRATFKLVKPGLSADASYSGSVQAFGESISFQINYNGGVPDFLVDSVSYTTMYLRITKRAGKVKKERSSDGSSWTQISDTENASIGSAAALKVTMTGSANGVNRDFSLQAMSVDGLYASGYFVSNAVTAGANALIALGIWSSSAGGSGSSHSIQLSADNGSNYTTLSAIDTATTIGTAGTSLRIKINLTADTADKQSPYYSGYAYQWVE